MQTLEKIAPVEAPTETLVEAPTETQNERRRIEWNAELYYRLAVHGFSYGFRQVLGREGAVAPLAIPDTSIPVADLLV